MMNISTLVLAGFVVCIQRGSWSAYRLTAHDERLSTGSSGVHGLHTGKQLMMNVSALVLAGFVVCIQGAVLKTNLKDGLKNSFWLPVLNPRSPGELNPRITNGTAAKLGQFPWQVAIIIDSSELCGGSLISDQWILTAAHCLNTGTNFEVVLGSLIYYDYLSSVVTSTKIVHPEYNGTTHQYDLGLLKLPQAVAFTASLEASEYLLYVEIPVLAHSECVRIYGSSIVTDQIICTQSTNGESTCSGDSGGPLVIVDSEGNHTQIGLVSFGATGLCAEYPTGYTNVAENLAWILQNTGL
ncbi:unnamed protein product [Timema podura]|uniref:Peptidase S1 domain-containing protein n=1 Tax=Timema podura TaxID=61482 RepID=A0ABN7NL28_TIMPD|nr:unnamed protein product [Timema podura]